jgi:hypothetical protein
LSQTDVLKSHSFREQDGCDDVTGTLIVRWDLIEADVDALSAVPYQPKQL